MGSLRSPEEKKKAYRKLLRQFEVDVKKTIIASLHYRCEHCGKRIWDFKEYQKHLGYDPDTWKRVGARCAAEARRDRWSIYLFIR